VKSFRTAVERGQGIVEFAVIFPVFIMLVFVMIDGGVLMGRYNQVNHAAQEGARHGATGATQSAVEQQTRRQSMDLLGSVPATCNNGAPERICVEWFDGPNSAGEVGSYVRVTVRYDFGFVTPINNPIFNSIGAPDHMDVDSCAIARLERPVTVPSGRSRSGTPQC
jgi:Flp pilus assembly protein TadG